VKLLVAAVYGDTITCQLVGGDAPSVGLEYFLEDARYGTTAQNRFFHLLVRMYYDSGCYSDNATSFYELRQHILRRLGKGFEKYLWSDEEGNLHVCEAVEEIPEYIMSSDELKRLKVRAQLYKWSQYSLKERRSTIKTLITEMINTGVSGKEFESILQEFHNG